METIHARVSAADAAVERLERDFVLTLDKLEAARPFGKTVHQARLWPLALKLLATDDGTQRLYRHASRFDPAGLFLGSDWAYPETLSAALARGSLEGDSNSVAVECLSELRLLAIALGDATHDAVDSGQARSFLEDILARNIDVLHPVATETSRETGPKLERVRRLFTFLAARLGTAGILEALVTECERVMLQRPIMVARVRALLDSAARALPAADPRTEDGVQSMARWMIDAVNGPTELARQHPQADDYAVALAELAPEALESEAKAFAHSMDATGLVCPLHATLLQSIDARAPQSLAGALALSDIGHACLAEFRPLISQLVAHAVRPDTAGCIYGLSRLLNRGILFFQPVAPGLQHLLVIDIHPDVAARLAAGSSFAEPPPPSALLLAGTLSVLGQPRGVDQGHNPTCQAARAISLWSQNDVGYLIELISDAATDDEVVMHFEGAEIRSSELSFGLAEELHTELDAVSLLLTPHLDKIYMEMSRRTIGRSSDGHRWVNPELHGWWVYRGFASLIEQATGAISGLDDFVRGFHAAYHPQFNGGRELVYAQPCGVVSTDPNGEFVGWHAVSIQRVAADPAGHTRVYFFNPNRDKGQDWGQGIVTSTSNHGELEGESSLPFGQFLARLYLYHYKQQELGDKQAVPAELVAAVRDAVVGSWGADREWADGEAQT